MMVQYLFLHKMPKLTKMQMVNIINQLFNYNTLHIYPFLIENH